ncbi:MAG TPA: DUF1684 domain-containing protein [Vicinamibacterales bacterium]|nr:DUF1684 domain-containing protein [Vicinamibacterales bacterium]
MQSNLPGTETWRAVSRAPNARRHRHIALVMLAVLALGSAGGCRRDTREPASVAPDTASADAAVMAWRAKHESDYRREFASIAGLHLLKPGQNRAGSAASNDVVLPASTPESVGRFTLVGERVRFEPSPDARVLMSGQPVTRPVDLKDDSRPGADELVVGDVRLVVHVSGDRRAIRVRDPNGPLARGFLGFAWFPVDAQYRTVGRFIKDPEPRKVTVGNTYGDEAQYTTEGVVEFQLRRQTLRLRPFTTRPGRLYFVFRDASSGEETYETARFLYSDLRPDGTTVLDFNMAYNPPCAFNPYTTCPIPLRENRLPVKILAGEKDYPVDVALPDDRR